MLTPAIPYITLPEIPILTDAITIKPFGTLVAAGVYIGWSLATRQAKRLGMNLDVFNSFVGWVVVIGFIGGHWIDVLLYHLDKVTEVGGTEAVKEMLFIWRSQSSFGGFIGAVCGVFIWKYRNKQSSIIAFADTLASAFPLGWVFGRMGCSVAHDHPGMRSDAWIAVQYPNGGRFDLGLYEMLFTVPLALTLIWLMRKPRPYGFYLGAMSVAYAPTRFALDFLRAEDVRDPDPRHFGLTPAQWLCIGLLFVGLALLRRAALAAERGETPRYVPEETPAKGALPEPKHA